MAIDHTGEGRRQQDPTESADAGGIRPAHTRKRLELDNEEINGGYQLENQAIECASRTAPATGQSLLGGHGRLPGALAGAAPDLPCGRKLKP